MSRLTLFCCCFVFTFLCCTSDTQTNSIPPSKVNQAPNDKIKEETLRAKEKLRSDIQKIEQAFSKELEKIDKEKALNFITKSELFVQNYSDDPQNASILFNAAGVAKRIGEYGRALKLWDTVYNRYNDYEKAPDALFMQGFTFENDLKDIKLAKMHYANFLKKYPKHDLAEQITIILKNIDKSSEELIKEFKISNKDAAGKKM